MKSQIALTPEQMRELQALGLDCSDASMCWVCDPNDETHRQLCVHDEYCWEVSALKPVPAYSLEDIILKINAEITYNDQIADDPEIDDVPWQCSYASFVGWENLKHNAAQGMTWGNSPLKAAFQALKDVAIYFPNRIKKLDYRKDNVQPVLVF